MTPAVTNFIAVTTTQSGPAVSVHGWLVWIIIGGVISSSGYAIYKVVWPSLRKIVEIVNLWPSVEQLAAEADQLKTVASMSTGIQTVVNMMPKLEEMSEQFKNNGGTSMRDAIDHNTKVTEKVAHDVAAVKQDITALTARVIVLEDKP